MAASILLRHRLSLSLVGISRFSRPVARWPCSTMMRGEAAAALVLPVRRYSAAAAPSAASSSTPSSSRPTPRYTVEQQRDKILAELRITRFAQPSLDRVAYLLVNCKTTDDWAADMKCLRAYLRHGYQLDQRVAGYLLAAAKRTGKLLELAKYFTSKDQPRIFFGPSSLAGFLGDLAPIDTQLALAVAARYRRMVTPSNKVLDAALDTLTSPAATAAAAASTQQEQQS